MYLSLQPIDFIKFLHAETHISYTHNIILTLSVTFFKIHTNLKCGEYNSANAPPSTFRNFHS